MSEYFAYNQERHFAAELPSQWPIIMVKVLPFRFQNSFPCYLSKGPLKWDFLHIYLTTVFRVRKIKNPSAMRVIFFFKIFKIESKFGKWEKKSRKSFFFWDNCIWRCCNKLPLLRRVYFSSAVSYLTNSPKFCISLRETFPNWIAFTVINKPRKVAVVQISTVFRPVYDVTCWRVLWNWTC